MADGTGFNQDDVNRVADAHRNFSAKIRTSVQKISSEVQQVKAQNPSQMTGAFDETWQEFSGRLTNEVEKTLNEMADAMTTTARNLTSQDESARQTITSARSGSSPRGGTPATPAIQGSQWAQQQY